MTTLAKRATPSQQMLMRIIEGAVKNVEDVHPDFKIKPHYRRSIAKRAAGTIGASWPDVLAAKPQSDLLGSRVSKSPTRQSDYEKAGGQSQQVEAVQRSNPVEIARRGASHMTRRSPLKGLDLWLRRQMYALKQEPNEERRLAYIEVFRAIAVFTNYEPRKTP